jgi:hypothetical protein
MGRVTMSEEEESISFTQCLSSDKIVIQKTSLPYL